MNRQIKSCDFCGKDCDITIKVIPAMRSYHSDIYQSYWLDLGKARYSNNSVYVEILIKPSENYICKSCLKEKINTGVLTGLGSSK